MCAECVVLREVVRKQGEFIQRIKREIRDFTTTDAQTAIAGGRAIADRGLRTGASK